MTITLNGSAEDITISWAAQGWLEGAGWKPETMRGKWGRGTGGEAREGARGVADVPESVRVYIYIKYKY